MADDTQGKATQRSTGSSSGQAATTAAERVSAARDDVTVTRTRAAAPAAAAASADAPDTRPTAEEIAKRDPKTYRATERGYADGRVIEDGEVFTTRVDKGSWMDPVKGSQKYGVEAAVDEAQYARKVDVNYENMDEPALQALAALVGVGDPGSLKKPDLIAAIRAARVPQAQ